MTAWKGGIVSRHVFTCPDREVGPIWFDVDGDGQVLSTAYISEPPRIALPATQEMYDTIVRTGQFAGSKYADGGKQTPPWWVARWSKSRSAS